MAGEQKGSDGARISGLVTDEQNKPPRVCSNCVWIGMGTCGNRLITDDPENAPLLDKDGRVKVEVALARGKNVRDKRQTLVERDAKRQIEREVKSRR